MFKCIGSDERVSTRHRDSSKNCLWGALAAFFKPSRNPTGTPLSPLGEISLLQRRQIEASIAVPLIRGYEQEMGVANARERAAEVIMQLAAQSGEQMADKIGGRMIPHLVRVVKEIWCREEALIIEILEESADRFSFNVTRCGYADRYKELGVREYGPILSCRRDEAFIRGFNARIGLERTQTIMDGAPFCDFRFEMKRGAIQRSRLRSLLAGLFRR